MNMNIVRDIGTVLVRELRPTLYDPISPIFTMGQPLIFLAFFGPLLSGMAALGGGSPWQWFVPGNLVMLALFGTSMTGANLLYEMQTGAHERMMVTPLSRSALLIGRALKEMVPLVVQALVIVAAVLPFGFRLYPLGAALGLLILGVFGVGLGALSYALAIAVRKQEWLFWAVQQTLQFPLLILSGTMLPLDGGPAWMQVASRANPFTYIVEAERALFAGDLAHPSVLLGALAAVALAALGLFVGTRAIRRSSG
jgi:ABC-2 type transport system permease protein